MVSQCSLMPDCRVGLRRSAPTYGKNGSELEVVLHDYALYKSTFTLLYFTGRREHISPVLHELHWLPVRRRVDFKLATLMFKSLHGCAPSYLSGACKSASEASRRLRSSGAITCVIPWSRTRLGDRSFDVAGTSCLLHCGHLTVSANSEEG